MDLDEDIEADASGQREKGFEFGLIERGGDEQHTVRAHESRIADIALADGEVLAQHRQRTGRASNDQILDGSTEEFDISEHRQTGRSTCLVLLGQLRRIKTNSQIALGG